MPARARSPCRLVKPTDGGLDRIREALQAGAGLPHFRAVVAPLLRLLSQEQWTRPLRKIDLSAVLRCVYSTQGLLRELQEHVEGCCPTAGSVSASNKDWLP